MFGIGFSELVVIAIVALIFVGPKRLPEVMKQAGKLFVHVRRTANDVKGTFDSVVREAEADIRREETEQMRALMSGAAKPVNTATAIDSGVVGSHAMADHPLDTPRHDVPATVSVQTAETSPAAEPAAAAAPSTTTATATTSTATESPKGQA